MNLTSTEILE